MTPRLAAWLSRQSRTVRALVVLALMAAIVCLDRDGCGGAQHAAVVSWVVAALEAVWNVIEVVGTAVVVSLEAIVAWLVTAVGWLAGVVAAFMRNVGAMFSKVWGGVKVLWSDVLRPVIRWVDTQILRLRDWLKRTFTPVFTWLQRIRDEVQHVYNRFLRPVFETIDFIRQLDRLLVAVHIRVLTGIDAALTQLEQRIEEPLHWIYGRLAEITQWVNVVVTADGYLQRYTLLRSLARDVGYQWRILVNSGVRDLTLDEEMKLKRAGITMSPDETRAAVGAYLRGEHNDVGDVIDAIVDNNRAAFLSIDSG